MGEPATEEKSSEGKEAAAAATTAAEKIELDAEQYNALMDRIAAIEEENQTLRNQSKERTTTLDELADEGRRSRQPVKETNEPPDLERLSNTELFNYIMDVGGQQMQQLNVAIETMNVVREIDKAEAKHEDFWEYETDVRKLAMANPTLSIEQAYNLAKQSKSAAKADGKDKGSDKDTSDGRTQTEKLLKLPSRLPTGDRPGSTARSATTTTGRNDVSRKDAATAAWDKVVGKDKNSI